MAVVACYGGTYTRSDAAGSGTFRSDSHVIRFMKLLPSGPAWTRRAGTVAYSLYRGLSHEFARVSRRSEDLLLRESDPRLASELLVDWERLTGMPRFGALAATQSRRRSDVHREITYRPDISYPGLAEAAAARGFALLSVTRRVYSNFTCTSKCNAAGRGGQWRYVWGVTAVAAAGAARAEFESWVASLTPRHTVAEHTYVTASLQPTIASPLAQWALGDDAGYLASDRSGNGRTLSNPSPRMTPDLREGFFALYSGSNVNFPPTIADAALRLTGAMTLTCRLWRSYSNNSEAVTCSASGDTAAANKLYSLGMLATFLTYRAETGAGVEVTFQSTLMLEAGTWYFAALRRNSAGTVVTLTLGDTVNAHETSGVLSAPTGGSTSAVYISYSADPSANIWLGGISDVCIWNTELTDAQLDTLRAAAMGG